MKLKRVLDKLIYTYKNIGLKGTVVKVTDKIFKKKPTFEKINSEKYVIWQEKNNLSEDEILKQRKTKFEYEPKISIVVPLYNTKYKYFEELVNSVRLQTYTNWELCLIDASEKVNSDFEAVTMLDKKIVYKRLGENKGIAENTNEGLKIATGDYVAFLDHDDLLYVSALFEVVKAINENRDIDFLYTDEDKIADSGERFDPHFKPDFSPEMLECTNYITHLVVAKKELIENVGFLRKEFDGAQDFDYVLRLTNKAKVVYHIPKVLYHWRVAEGSTAKNIELKNYAIEAGTNALNRYFKDYYNEEAKAYNCPEVPGVYKVEYKLKGNPRVNIIIPNKDSIKYLDRAINSILEETTYDNYKILVIENNSENQETFDYYKTLKEKSNKIEVLTYKGKFNYSRIINFGVKNSKDAEYILQLNNDIKVLTKNWLEQMIALMQKDGVGAVGARLYYEDLSLQHAGISYGIAGTAGNMLVNLPKGRHAYLGFEAMQRNVSAVTGACLMTKRSIYEEVDYMNENLAVAFNDVDFCLKIREKGYRIVYTPWVELIHYESKTRGYEDTPKKKERFEKEKDVFIKKWKMLLDENKDPYLNINFSRDSVDYIIEDKKIK